MMSNTPRKVRSTSNSADEWFYMRQFNLSTKDKDAIKRDFDHSVRFYSALLKNCLPIDKKARIFDLPCGEGRMLYALKTKGYKQIIGYDTDRQRLKTGRTLDLPVHEGDIFDVLQGEEDRSIDCVIAMDIIEHLEKEDVIRFLDLAFRRIKLGGKLIVRTPCADNPFGVRDIFNDFTHKWAATSSVLHQLLENSGFSETHVFGEEPRLGMRFGFVRVPLHFVTKILLNIFLKAFGHGPLGISSRSMWATARKG